MLMERSVSAGGGAGMLGSPASPWPPSPALTEAPAVCLVPAAAGAPPGAAPALFGAPPSPSASPAAPASPATLLRGSATCDLPQPQLDATAPSTSSAALPLKL